MRCSLPARLPCIGSPRQPEVSGSQDGPPPPFLLPTIAQEIFLPLAFGAHSLQQVGELIFSYVERKWRVRSPHSQGTVTAFAAAPKARQRLLESKFMCVAHSKVVHEPAPLVKCPAGGFASASSSAPSKMSWNSISFAAKLLEMGLQFSCEPSAQACMPLFPRLRKTRAGRCTEHFQKHDDGALGGSLMASGSKIILGGSLQPSLSKILPPSSHAAAQIRGMFSAAQVAPVFSRIGYPKKSQICGIFSAVQVSKVFAGDIAPPTCL